MTFFSSVLAFDFTGGPECGIYNLSVCHPNLLEESAGAGTRHDRVTAVLHARLILNPTFLSLSGLQLYGNHQPSLIGFPNLLSRMKWKLPSDYRNQSRHSALRSKKQTTE